MLLPGGSGYFTCKQNMKFTCPKDAMFICYIIFHHFHWATEENHDGPQDAWYRWRDSKTEPSASGGTPLIHPQTFLYPSNPMMMAVTVYFYISRHLGRFCSRHFAVSSTAFRVVSDEISVTSYTAAVCKIWMSGLFINLLQVPSVTVYEFHRLSAECK